MKNFLSLLVVLTVLVGVVNANVDKPKSPVGMAVVKSGSGFKLFYHGLKRGDIKVTIYDAKGHAVHKETLHKVESFVRPYNLSSLNDGEYTVELTDADGTQLQKLTYQAQAATTRNLMRLVRVKGFDNKYMLMVPNKGNETLDIKIYDDSNSLIYNVTEHIQGDFAGLYKLNRIGKNFIFEITTKSGATTTLTN